MMPLDIAPQAIPPASTIRANPDYVPLYQVQPPAWTFDLDPVSGMSRASYPGNVVVGGILTANGQAPPLTVATAGPVSLTGQTGPVFVTNLRIPANSIGRNGAIQITSLWSYTNNANTKQVLGYLASSPNASPAGSLSLPSATLGAQAIMQGMWIVRANNATNAQIGYSNPPMQTPFGTGTGPPNTGTVDTTQDSYVNFQINLSVGTDTVTLLHAYAVVFGVP